MEEKPSVSNKGIIFEPARPGRLCDMASKFGNIKVLARFIAVLKLNNVKKVTQCVQFFNKSGYDLNK